MKIIYVNIFYSSDCVRKCVSSLAIKRIQNKIRSNFRCEFWKNTEVLEFPGLGRKEETSVLEKVGGERRKWCTILEHNLILYINILKFICLAANQKRVFLKKL